MGLRRWITAEPARAVVAAFVVVFAVSAGAIGLLVNREVGEVLEHRRQAAAAVKVRLEVLLRVAENQLALIAGEAETFISENRKVETTPPDRRAVLWQSRSSGGLHSFELLSHAERGPDVGNLIAYEDFRARAAGLTRTPGELLYDATLALAMSRAFQVTFRQNRSGSVYFIGSSGLMYVYPWTKTRESGFGDDVFLQDVFQLGRPEANPKRRPFWTPAYLDMAGLGLVASHGAPLYRDDTFIGVVALDIGLDGIRAFVRNERTRGMLMLADSQRRLIASSDPKVEDTSRLYSLAEQVPRGIEGEVLGSVSTKPAGQVVGDGHVVTFHRLGVAPWTVVEVLPLGEIYAGLAQVYGPPTALYAGILVLLFVFTYRVVGRTFRQVQEANEELSVAYFSLENAAEGIVWFDAEGIVIEANRMAAEIGGYKVGSLHGRHASELIPALSRADYPGLWELVKAGQRETPMEREFRRADGTLVPIESTAKYIKTGDREFACNFIRDISRRKEREDELRRVHYALENAADGVAWCDKHGRIVEANFMVGILTGRPREDLIGRPAGEMLQGIDEKVYETIWSVLKTRTVDTPGEQMLLRGDGTTLPVETLSKYISFGGREYICTFMRDITDRKRAQIEVLTAKEAAEEATKSKSAFLAMMSHEIRTPMNGVMSMAEMLDQTELSSDQRSMSQVIRASAQSLLTIINDILDFSKIEAGKLDIEAVEFSLLEVVEGAGELIAGRADEKGLSLAVDLDPQIPDRLIGDPTRLRQILLNLMGNAVKFTEAGGVLLSVERQASSADGLQLRFEIVDTGIGLTHEERGRLFQAFSQADTSTSRRYGGTGLGLSICRRLVDMMGGSIGVDSTPAVGSTFWLELPFRAVDPAPERPDPDIADARVLALGFEGQRRHALERLLAGAGITARFAAAEGDSLADATGEPSDLVLLAVNPGQDSALEIGRALAASGTKVALAAPRVMASTLAEADRAGLLAALTFPLRRHRLWRVIAASLGRADLDARDARDNENIGWAPPPEDEARAAGTLILVAEDNATNRIVISRLLSQRGYAHEMAEDGAEALSRIEMFGGYGLLLTDFHMPEMDGFELTRAVRAREAAAGEGKRMPIVALTADALSGTEERCLAAGMDAYLTKPIDSKLLAAALDKFLPAAKALRRRAGPAVAPSTASALPKVDPQILDLKRMVDAFGSFDDEARAFLGVFAGEARRTAEALLATLDAGDQAQARHHAHTLKGSARSSGARRLGDIAADIQDCLDGDDIESARLFAGGVMKTVNEFSATVASLLEPV